MNLLFWIKPKQKVELPILRVFEFPEDKKLDFLYLFNEVSNRRSSVATYKLWKYINDLFPETKKGNWSIQISQPTNPIIVERRKRVY
jgi:hypothetical protein